MILFRSLIFIILLLSTLQSSQENNTQYKGIANQLSLTFSDLVWKYESELIEQNLKSSIVNHQLNAIVLYDKGLKEYRAAWNDNNSIHYKKSDKPIKIVKEESFEKITKKMKKDQQELGELVLYYQKNKDIKINLTQKEKAYLEKHPILTVSNEQKWAPFNFNENGKAKGFSIDYFELIAKKVGFQINYINGPTWKEFTDMIKEKKLDVLLNVAYNEERTKWLEFTDNKYFQVHYGLAVNSTNSKIHEFNDILNKTVAIEKGFWLHKWLEKNHPNVNIKTYPNTLEALRAISLNEADVYVGNISVAGYLIKNNWLTNVKVKPLGKTKLKKTNDLYIGIPKDHLILKNIIDKAMSSLSNEEINQLHSKWFSKSENTDTTISLNEEESRWIQKHSVIKISNEMDYPPFDFVIGNEPKGYSIDFIKLIAERIGIKLEFVNGYTWDELWKMFERKELDIIHPAYKNSYREKFGIFSKQIFTGRTVFITKSDEPEIKSLKDLKDKIIAMPKGWATTKYFNENHPEIKTIVFDNVAECFQAVSDEKAYATMEMDAVASYILKTELRTDLKTNGWFKEFDNKNPNNFYYIVRNDWNILSNLLAKAQNSITVAELEELQNKWFGTLNKNDISTLKLTNEEREYLKNKDSLKICVDPDWLPFERIDEEGKYRGIGSDVMKIISNKINKPINLIQTISWPETVEKFLDKKCEILPVASSTPNRLKIMNFTKPYIKKSLVVATKEDQFFIQDSSELIGKKIALVEDYAFIELLKHKHPTIDIVPVKNIKEGLKKVQNKEIFGFVDALPSIAYIIQKEAMVDLKIAGRLEFDVELGIASQNDEPLLNTIMQKALDDIPNEQIDSIIGKWISIKVAQSFDYRMLIYTTIVFLIIVVLLMYRQYYINKMNKKLEKISITDALTNIYNRRHFNEVFPKVINSAKRDNDLVSFLIMDIDHFKQYNDTYGHQMGDEVLTKVAKVIKDSLHRANDYCFRLGGEEFGVIYKADSKEKAFEFANTIRENIENLHIEHRGNSASKYVTASFGLICKNASEIKNEDEVYKEGDGLLYEAKESGRNRVCFED